MDIHSLQAFVEVARLNSFSQAADTLFITQPAVSKRIAALEDELNTRLFDRIGRNTTLTEAGRALLPRAQTLLREAEDMRRFASTLSETISGQLVMGTSHHIGLHRLPPVLKAFKQAYPDVRLDIRFMDSEQACHAVEQGELELAIVTLPSSVPENLLSKHVWTDRLEVVVNPEHPLAKQRKVSLQELVKHPCVLPSSSTYTHSILKQALIRHKLEPVVNMTTNYLETLKMLVITDFGWSLIPHTMLDKQLVALTTELKLERELGTVVHQKRARSNAATAMLEIVSTTKTNT